MIELGTGGVLEYIEPVMEVINFIVAAAILGLSIVGLAKAGGTIKQAWVLLTTAALFFGMLELTGILKGFKVFEFHGLADLIEFSAIIFLLLAVRKLNQLF
ncbi:hypothetical protein A3C91_00210 [Candidatus Azambacteria bacterium RIFCSPHIGHO2_02_FULL_52_12]|uniref:Uncharacterized protein n=1 Tax=Candidatus Azambacteria bacterium RIFCSPLOWO2_01_FULL_46_25 TaxID=1797298 RepID=A0A1F5BUK9_9BACT|nr:MAG: hypothetical protein A3C91_00210 [Candidatus Azambacteria bacterium RIFCSPHIGHO2_02_FULL_52_12]OGD34309.1 MAG: hypothetical protein A2988_02150 [Candidatus Azambacteria bacterium RIFCSPLOWO2_01_FULL_46_25]OGD37764.1 MAG: hypothetical protein A2850_03435 [Candidatus Azambacteria bacterium RIFCSPHIGHO2_01_FULL_51_74]